MSKLLTRADIDLQIAEQLLSTSGNPNDDYLITNIAAFHAQQAIEKALKYKIKISGMPYADTHNLEELINILESNKFAISSELKTVASDVSSWETSYQYDDDFYAVKSNVEYAVQSYKELRKQL